MDPIDTNHGRLYPFRSLSIDDQTFPASCISTVPALSVPPFTCSTGFGAPSFSVTVCCRLDFINARTIAAAARTQTTAIEATTATVAPALRPPPPELASWPALPVDSGVTSGGGGDAASPRGACGGRGGGGGGGGEGLAGVQCIPWTMWMHGDIPGGCGGGGGGDGGDGKGGGELGGRGGRGGAGGKFGGCGALGGTAHATRT